MTPALVVLTDFFAVSNRALSYAAGLAVPLHAHLVLLHVRHDALLSPEQYAQRSEQQVYQALNHLAEDQPVPTQVEISARFLPEAVEDSVHHHQPQLLVLGRSSTAPIEVVASAATDLLRHVPYPLLIVPPVGWDAFPPRRLALAVDGEPFSLYDSQQIVPQLQHALHASLQVIYVAKPDAPEHAPEQILRTIRTSGLGEKMGPDSVHIVRSTEPAAGIQQAAAELGVDMLVVVARQHTLLGGLFHHSVTAQLIGESAIPVLLLPALG
ncbi:universal stress protein [Hymenobacter tenuis]